MTGKDIVVKVNASLQRILIPDFWAVLKGKKHAKDIEKLINQEIDQLQHLKYSIELGEEKMFGKSVEEGIAMAKKEKKDEETIHTTHFRSELQEEERIKKINEKLIKLKKFADSKKIVNKELLQEINEIHKLMEEVGSMAKKQAKMDFNLAHGHHAFARFVQLRNIHSVANRLKVLEKKTRKDRNHEMKDFDDLEKDFDKAMKSDSIEGFNDAISVIHKELNNYITDAKSEFTHMVDGNQMVALLVDHSIEYVDKLKTLLVDAKDKGYDEKSADELAKKINDELKSFHDLSNEFLSQDRTSGHGINTSTA